MSKKRTQKNYFGVDQEEAVVRYLDSESEEEKSKEVLKKAAQNAINRILSIPQAYTYEDYAKQATYAEELTEKWKKRYGTMRLRPVQGWALHELREAAKSGTHRGLFCPIGVGFGKTGITLLAAKAVGAKRPLLLIPPKMRAQFKRDTKIWLQHFNFMPPKMMPYSQLSSKKNSSFLADYRPDLIIADEAHSLKHRTSSRTKRLTRYFRKNPSARFVALSGTLVTDKTYDYWHLLELALRDYMPLPVNYQVFRLWANVLDADSDPSKEALQLVAPLYRQKNIKKSSSVSIKSNRVLYQSAKESARARARLAYGKRLRTTPGVITARGSSCDARLILTLDKGPPMPTKLADYLSGLRKNWTMPDGTPVVDAALYSKQYAAITSGFFYEQIWVDDVVDEEWLVARSAWHQAMRTAKRYDSRDGHDSAALISEACARGEGPKERVAAWRAWDAIKDRAKLYSRPVWLDHYMDAYILDWVRSRKRGLVWYQFASAWAPRLAKLGLRVYGAGSDTPPNKVDHPAVSGKVHCEGKNMQAWDDQVFLHPPANAGWWQQALGRTHRQAQRSDVVKATILIQTQRARKSWEKTLKRATTIQQKKGEPQKLLYCEIIDEAG